MPAASLKMATILESLNICEYLESILKDTFGPCGLDVMLNSSSGKVLVTNSGGVIVNSLSAGHPVARLFVDKVKCHNDITGAGGTAFILVLTEALREITKLLEFKGCTGEVNLKPHSSQLVVSLSKAFLYIQSDLLTIVQPTLDKLAVVTDLTKTNKDTVKKNFKDIIDTCLNGKFSPGLQTLLSSLLVKLVTNSCTLESGCLYQDVLELIDNFPQVCVEVHGVSVQSSFTDHGFVLTRELATGEDAVLPPPGEENVVFVILHCSLDNKAPETSAVMEIKSAEAQSKSLLYNQSSTFSLLKCLQQQGVKLVISTQGVSTMALHLCRQLGIAVIQMVPMETTHYICKRMLIQPICDVSYSEWQNLPDGFKGKLLSCESKLIAGQTYTQIRTPKSALNTHFIVLCAPTQGISQQYCIALCDALKCLKMSFSESREKLVLLPGCGSLEFSLSQVMGDLAKSTVDGTMATAFKVLSQSLLNIPKMLHMNSNQSGGPFVSVMQKIKFSWKEGTLLGVDGRTGNVLDPRRVGIFEPYHGKLLWLSHLLQCLSMVLRTDRIVRVKCSKDTTMVNKMDQ